MECAHLNTKVGTIVQAESEKESWKGVSLVRGCGVCSLGGFFVLENAAGFQEASDPVDPLTPQRSQGLARTAERQRAPEPGRGSTFKFCQNN